jgi:hypothetical protein
MLVGACSSSKGTSGSTAPAAQQVTAGYQALNPGTGAPQSGGTLNEIGVSDVQYMDYDLDYYTTDAMVMRLTETSLLAGRRSQTRPPRRSPRWPPACR